MVNQMKRMRPLLITKARARWFLSIVAIVPWFTQTVSAQEPSPFLQPPSQPAPTQPAPTPQRRLPLPQPSKGAPADNPIGGDRRAPAGNVGGAFDQQDPTQAAPDMRRILEGEQDQIQRNPPPAIEVVGKVIGTDGSARALLRVNGRYLMVEQGTRFSVSTNVQPLVFTLKNIDAKGVELEGGEEKTVQRLQ